MVTILRAIYFFNFDLTQTTIRMICVIGGFLIPLFSIYTFIFILDRWIKNSFKWIESTGWRSFRPC